MRLDGSTKLQALLKNYPYLLDVLVSLSPEYAKLKNPVLRQTLGRFATLEQVADQGKIPLSSLLARLEQEIAKREEAKQQDPGPPGSETSAARTKIEALKQIIRELHRGGQVEELKRRFAELIKDVGPEEIARLEQQVIEEGMPEEEVKRLCDLHVKIFEESLEAQKKPEASPGHPVHTLMAENREAEKIIEEIKLLLKRLPKETAELETENLLVELKVLLTRLSEIDLHYLRKENQLFPLLESRGVTGPTKVMWAIHDDIRKAFKELKSLLEKEADHGSVSLVREKTSVLLQMVQDMIYKEEKILLPMSLEVLTEDDWVRVRHGEEEIGYAWVRPGAEWKPDASPAEAGTYGSKVTYGEETGPGRASEEAELPAQKVAEKKSGQARRVETYLSLSTGRLTAEQIDLMLTHLPVDISFVDENDTVIYYSDTPERVFPRSPGVIGRKVQNCHPPKSVGVVNRILEAFKKGEKDVAEFWIELNGRFIHIRYFAVRDDDGRYRGCLEVTQDVTSIRALQGQKRLLDWT